jgi:hypothetical protein
MARRIAEQARRREVAVSERSWSEISQPEFGARNRSPANELKLRIGDTMLGFILWWKSQDARF